MKKKIYLGEIFPSFLLLSASFLFCFVISRYIRSSLKKEVFLEMYFCEFYLFGIVTKKNENVEILIDDKLKIFF